MYSPGAQSDEILLLFSDGTGRLDIYNPVTVNALAFRWTIEDATRMRIVGEHYFSIEESPTRVVIDEWNYEEVLIFSIQHEETPSGRHMQVLRFEQPIVEWLPKEFGFCRDDIDTFRSPDFSWVGEFNRGYLGVEFGASPEDQGGVVVHRVICGGAAEHAGIEVGDVIRYTDNQIVGTLEKFQSLIQNWSPSQVISLGLIRGGEEVRLEVRLMSRQECLSQEDTERG